MYLKVCEIYFFYILLTKKLERFHYRFIKMELVMKSICQVLKSFKSATKRGHIHFRVHSNHHCPVHAVTLLDARYKNKFFASDEWRVDARKRRSRRSNNLGETYVQVYLGALSQKVKDEQ